MGQLFHAGFSLCVFSENVTLKHRKIEPCVMNSDQGIVHSEVEAKKAKEAAGHHSLKQQKLCLFVYITTGNAYDFGQKHWTTIVVKLVFIENELLTE